MIDGENEMVAISNDDIKKIVVKVVPNLDYQSLDADTLLRKYPIDSIDFYTIILDIQEHCGIEVPDSDLEKFETINAIRLYCEAQ